jgi:Fe-S-cluster containining protein
VTLLERYRALREAVDAEFARARRVHGARITCHGGCSDCCGQLFQITEMEAASISAGMAELPDPLRQRLRQRAVVYLEARAKLRTADGGEERWGRLPRPGLRLPCPALEDGHCQIYEHRPLICRKYGAPLFDPSRPDQLQACPLNFKDGDAVDDPDLVPAQTVLHARQRDLEAEYNEAGGPRQEAPLNVARALLEDFSAVMATLCSPNQNDPGADPT